MAYFSAEEPMLGNPLGCGPGCSCGPCRSGVSGFNEWYVKDEDEEPPFEVRKPGPPSNNVRQPLNGWFGDGFGFYRLGEETPAQPADSAPPQEQAPTPADQGPAPSQPEPTAPQPGPSQQSAPKDAKPGTPDQNREDADLRLIRESLSRGIRNVKRLTDIVFFARHPDKKDSSTWSSEPGLFDEWQEIRERLVIPEFHRGMRRPPRPRIIIRRPRVMRRGLHGNPQLGFGYFSGPPACDPSRRDLTAIADDLKLINNELGRGAGASAVRLTLKRKLLDLEVDGMIHALDFYIESGCCEPSLKTLEMEIQALPWPPIVAPTKVRLLSEISAAQARARKDFKHC
jgi:hypothetical protein